jgi:hypothetical protein
MLATFYELIVAFWKKLVEGRGGAGGDQQLISLFTFSESTCSGVFITSYGFSEQYNLGEQVPQHDV